MSLDAYDYGAEQSLLGSVIEAPDVAADALLGVPDTAFTPGKHQVIAATLTRRIRAGDAIDPQLVLADIATRIDAAGPYLLRLQERAWVPSNAALYAARVRELAAIRNLAQAAIRLSQRLNEAAAEPDRLPSAIADMLVSCAVAEDAISEIAATPSPTIADLLNEDVTYDWLVPGLLERAERILLTGFEGFGKSTLIAQFAACLAAGLHPFTGERLGHGDHALRVLLIDAENNRRQLHRRYARIARVVDIKAGPGWRHNIAREIRPEGLDLLGTDGAWLAGKMAINAPDVLIIGPIYKLHRGNLNDEGAARELVHVLDSVRTRHHCALIMESHPGHAEDASKNRRVRPVGSSLFLRWPEFGFGLARAKGASEGANPNLVDVIAWRGSREERAWPRQLKYGCGGQLPWVPANLDYYDQPARSTA